MKHRRFNFGFRHLHYFVISAEQGSFRRAGLALNVQESAISRRVRDLEDMIGASLFHRHSSGVTLTFAGEAFLDRSRAILNALHETITEAGAIGRGENGRIAIGVFSSLASGFLWTLLYEFGCLHPEVELELIDGNPAEHVSEIRRLRLDIAFVTGSRAWADCDHQRLWCERVFLVCPDAHALAAHKEITWSDVAGETFIVSETAPGQEIRNYLIQRLADLGYHPDIATQAVGRDNLMSLVAIGRGLTVTSEATIPLQVPGVTYLPIQGEVLPFGAVWSPSNDNPAFRRLLSMAKAMSAATKVH